jgi:5'-nucleotidase / UDP-sugar diphosphatase
MSLTSLRRSALVLAVATATVAGGALAGPASAGDKHGGNDKNRNHPAGPDFTLTLLHANDQESALLPITGTDGGSYAGAARFTELLERERAAAGKGRPSTGQAGKRGVITISAGDHFLPGVQLAASDGTGEPIYDATAFAAADWDVATFGNHDFDQTPDFLAEWLDDVFGPATSPDRDRPETIFVSNNLGFDDEPKLMARVDDGTIVTSYVQKVKGERIGIIGLTTPDLPELTSLRDVTVDPAPLAEIANAQAAAYERRGVDKVILVSHLQNIRNEEGLAPHLSGIDIIVGAGGGELLADPGDPVIPNDTDVFDSYPIDATDADGENVPIVTTTGLYQYVGRLVVTFDRDGELLSIDEAASKPLRVSAQGPDAVAPDQAVLDQVEQPVAAALERFDQEIIGSTEVPLNGVRNDVRSQETNLGNLVADSLLAAGQRQAAATAGVTEPVVALQNGGGIRNASELPVGELSLLDAFTVLPFANFVSVAPQVPIEQFVATVENAVSANQVVSNGQAIDQLQPEGRFAQIAGFEFTYDASAPVNDRVQSLVITSGDTDIPVVAGGELVAGAPTTVSVASIDFLFRGGDGYFAPEGVDFLISDETYQEALVAFIDQLDGGVTSADYPVGGEGRITEVD